MQQLISCGYAVLGTANPCIASAMAREGNYAALLVFVHSVNLATLSAIVNTRRSRPELPVIIIFDDRSADSIPAGLADLVLYKPAANDLNLALSSVIERNDIVKASA
jgi:DNA-binding response OmpR family regulator